ncbi:universal stress protein [Shewanella eurypsychrophilus]|uniref:Universal stress protein n=1 Tax=Shewanella eurypsychrophilus TaxID=2593656 RepID=A0ABX6V874_9GAMM|nr:MULTISPECIES: universal stress protein [Shewanella]QFU23627.1 universal stress protein [Shewanella sp. YLB-09]QPG58850.1 universal stress protein [Shewanella eurypsychrophilus]
MSYKHILLSVALNKDSYKTLEKAADLAKLNNAKLSLIHIDLDIPHTYEGMLGSDYKEQESIVREESITSMKRLIDSLDIDVAHHYPIQKQVINAGDLDNEILDYIDKHDIDLLIMGHHKSNFLSQFFISPTEPVIRNMPCDLMFIKLDN